MFSPWKIWNKKTDLLTVYDVDLAALVIGAQGNSTGLLGCHCAHCPLTVGTLNVGVIIWVVLRNNVFSTAWIQSSLDGVPAIWFVPPCDNGRLRRGCLVITLEGDRLEEDYNVPLGGALDWDSYGILWKKNKKQTLLLTFSLNNPASSWYVI